MVLTLDLGIQSIATIRGGTKVRRFEECLLLNANLEWLLAGQLLARRWPHRSVRAAQPSPSR